MAPWSDAAKKGESGLADDYILTIATSKFGFPFEDNAEACNLILGGERNIDGVLDDGHVWLGAGDFEPGDKDGTFAIHSSQDAGRHFNKNSKLGKFIQSALAAGVPLEERQTKDRMQHEDKDALVWIGLRLKIHEEEREGVFKRGPDKGKTFTSRQPLVVEYLGTADAPVESSAPAGPPADNGSNADKAKLLGAQSENYMEYLEKVTGQLGVDPTDEVASEAFYNSIKASA